MTTMLSHENHVLVQKYCLDYEKGNEDSKNVFIRDKLDEIFQPHYLHWRLTCDEIGVSPANRDNDLMSASGCWRRGAKVLDSGFSEAAIGTVHCFEDHPSKLHISKHTKDLKVAVI